jgi:hypothetical protein
LLSLSSKALSNNYQSDRHVHNYRQKEMQREKTLNLKARQHEPVVKYFT